MPGTFPSLRTGKVAQYPMERKTRLLADVQQFLNAAEQAYVDTTTARKAWRLSFTKLSDNEVATLKAFFESNQGRKGVFTFVDPWDAASYTTCSFAEDTFPQVQAEEGNNSLTLTVYEHP